VYLSELIYIDPWLDLFWQGLWIIGLKRKNYTSIQNRQNRLLKRNETQTTSQKTVETGWQSWKEKWLCSKILTPRQVYCSSVKAMKGALSDGRGKTLYTAGRIALRHITSWFWAEVKLEMGNREVMIEGVDGDDQNWFNIEWGLRVPIKSQDEMWQFRN
jgi:hypothetical protein